jgi:transposase-like protein
MRQRRRFDPEFKAKVVLELLRGERTAAQLAREHELGPDLLTQWRQRLLDRAPEVFREGAPAPAEAARVADLERLAGQQALELAVLKKALSWPRSGSGSSGR